MLWIGASKSSIESVEGCYFFFQTSAAWTQKKRDAARQRLITLLEERLVKVFPDGELNKVVEQIADRQQDRSLFSGGRDHPQLKVQVKIERFGLNPIASSDAQAG